MAVLRLTSDALRDGGDYASLRTESGTLRILPERKQVTQPHPPPPSLSAVVNLDELLAELIFKFTFKKSSVLQELSFGFSSPPPRDTSTMPKSL